LPGERCALRPELKMRQTSRTNTVVQENADGCRIPEILEVRTIIPRQVRAQRGDSVTGAHALTSTITRSFLPSAGLLETSIGIVVVWPSRSLVPGHVANRIGEPTGDHASSRSILVVASWRCRCDAIAEKSAQPSGTHGSCPSDRYLRCTLPGSPRLIASTRCRSAKPAERLTDAMNLFIARRWHSAARAAAMRPQRHSG